MKQFDLIESPLFWLAAILALAFAKHAPLYFVIALGCAILAGIAIGISLLMDWVYNRRREKILAARDAYREHMRNQRNSR